MLSVGAITNGSFNSFLQMEEYLQSNVDLIIRIQAKWKAHVQYGKYLQRREECRKKSSHFVTRDLHETISSERTIELATLLDENEADLEQLLVTKTHRY